MFIFYLNFIIEIYVISMIKMIRVIDVVMIIVSDFFVKFIIIQIKITLNIRK